MDRAARSVPPLRRGGSWCGRVERLKQTTAEAVVEVVEFSPKRGPTARSLRAPRLSRAHPRRGKPQRFKTLIRKLPNNKDVAGTRKRYFVDATGHISSPRENEAMISSAFANHCVRHPKHSRR